MDIIAACYTDAGSIKEMNQDSLSVKVVNSPNGKILFAIVCDGMGGLEHGEVASREVVVAFNNWFSNQFAQMVTQDSFSTAQVFEQWRMLIIGMNERISEYADGLGMKMGTTVSAMLVYQGEYFICHVGDSRIYRICHSVEQLTKDQTLVEQEVVLGKLTKEEAMVDPRRSILLQCVGASGVVEPQFDTGEITEETTFILSSDGFVHLISNEEIYEVFAPGQIRDKEMLSKRCEKMVKRVMERGEKDNITVIAAVCKQVV